MVQTKFCYTAYEACPNPFFGAAFMCKRYLHSSPGRNSFTHCKYVNYFMSLNLHCELECASDVQRSIFGAFFTICFVTRTHKKTVKHPKKLEVLNFMPCWPIGIKSSTAKALQVKPAPCFFQIATLMSYANRSAQCHIKINMPLILLKSERRGRAGGERKNF